MSEEYPRYGYGKGQRPLWSLRDREAEAIRRVLRRAGLRDVDERHPDGFAVEGSNSSLDGPEPFSVAYCGGVEKPETIARYRRILEQTGYQVDAEAVPYRHMLSVQRQPTPTAAPSGRGLLVASVVCAVLATVALVTSWAADGVARLAGGVGSAVFGVLAVWLAGLWYRRRAHLD